ncbi:glycosyltransferase protein [Herbaspirillum rubrisubalbicans M1]|uniref:glycosyltransferase n=1 Tax=Herbaspirillum rubrisubalbicans TaxID=80842 RepID=UPI00073A33BC|nr:glycosyltransferase [Herbaspirillum rubrisubalbicans]ALU87694.1 glycosyltransferase protein [Herbaspirillum rubrisubalbicans M1]
MRVLQFFKTALPDTVGGVEQVINQLAEGTSRRGVENTVLSLARIPERQVMQMNGYRVCRAPLDIELASTGFSRSALGWFRDLAREVDLIHYHFPWPFMDIAHFWARVKVPTLVTYHSDIVNQRRLLRLYQPLQSAFLRSVTRIVATSPNYCDSSPVLRRFAAKTEVIPLGIGSPPQISVERLDYWRGRFGDRFFLFVGVLRYYKGLHTLLEALQGTSYPVVIAGHGPEADALHAKAQALQLKHVHFLGKIEEEDKTALLQLCWAMLFPSHLRSEAFGVSLLEAAQHGKPMVTCELGTGTSYVNLANQTGLVVSPEHPGELRAAMDALWCNDEMRATMGLKAQERYREMFTAGKMVDAYLDLYERLIASQKFS